MFCSFVIPAHNEEDWIAGSVGAIRSVAQGLKLQFEVLVVADSCTDRTVELAVRGGATVHEVNCRQIGATRNFGARQAAGEVLFFVDADTEVTPEAVKLSLEALKQGAVGGGSSVKFDGKIPIFMRLAIDVTSYLLTVAGYTGGCFFYCKRAAFEQAGGFDEQLFIAEEIFLARALKKLGRFVVVRGRVLTSARKVRNHSPLAVAKLIWKTLVGGKAACMRREGLEFWYGERQSDPGRAMGNERDEAEAALPTSSASQSRPILPSTSESCRQPSGAGAPTDDRR